MSTPTVMPFGRHKGTAITELKASYVTWLLSLDDINADLRMDLEALVATREHQFQRRKELAIRLQQSHIPSYERKAYKQSRGRGWNNSTGWN